MKRMIMIAVLCTICFSVTSCAGNNSSSNDSTDNPTTQSATSASTEKVTEKSTEIVTEKTTEALTENQTEIETEPEMLDYTAVELAGKSLNEIIDIMGGNYEQIICSSVMPLAVTDAHISIMKTSCRDLLLLHKKVIAITQEYLS